MNAKTLDRYETLERQDELEEIRLEDIPQLDTIEEHKQTLTKWLYKTYFLLTAIYPEAQGFKKHTIINKAIRRIENHLDTINIRIDESQRGKYYKILFDIFDNSKKFCLIPKTNTDIKDQLYTIY